MNPRLILFVCEHGAAKSVVAAAYFNKMAKEKGMSLRAISRGTQPDEDLTPKAVAGLAADGLKALESKPIKLSLADMESASHIVTFCELPAEYSGNFPIHKWIDVPPISEDYQTSRNSIIRHIGDLLNQIKTEE